MIAPFLCPTQRPCHPERSENIRGAGGLAESKDPYSSSRAEPMIGILATPVGGYAPRLLFLPVRSSANHALPFLNRHGLAGGDYGENLGGRLTGMLETSAARDRLARIYPQEADHVGRRAARNQRE